MLSAAETLIYSVLALGIPVSPRGISGRVLIISVCLTGAFLFWGYCAGLTSLLTVEKYEFPIKTLLVSNSSLLNFITIKK